MVRSSSALGPEKKEDMSSVSDRMDERRRLLWRQQARQARTWRNSFLILLIGLKSNTFAIEIGLLRYDHPSKPSVIPSTSQHLLVIPSAPNSPKLSPICLNPIPNP
jgi:hypothetical protein